MIWNPLCLLLFGYLFQKYFFSSNIENFSQTFGFHVPSTKQQAGGGKNNRFHPIEIEIDFDARKCDDVVHISLADCSCS